MKHLALHTGDNAEAKLMITPVALAEKRVLGSRQKHSFTQ